MRGEQLDMSADESGDSSSPYTTSSPTPITSTPTVSQPTPLQRQPTMTLMKPGEEENARSAFEITSVTEAPADADELESSMRHPGQSSDEQQLKENLATKKAGEEDRGADLHSQRLADDGERLSMESEVTSGGNELVSVPTAVQQGASRFRRVNKYTRGRWVVRDTSEPEERTENSDVAMGNKGNLQLVATEGVGSPSLARRGAEEGELTRSTSELVPLASQTIVVAGGSDTTSERGDNLDKSLTTAETVSLSRNTSYSSLATTEKSVDNDEHLREVESEAPPPVPTGATNDPVTYAPSPLSTQSSQGHSDVHGDTCSCESCAEPSQGQKRRVNDALESLQQELDRLLENNARLRELTKENERLRDENSRLRQQNTTLSNEKESLISKVQNLERLLSERNKEQTEGQSSHEEAPKDRDLVLQPLNRGGDSSSELSGPSGVR